MSSSSVDEERYDGWVDFLSRNGVKFDPNIPVDMESSRVELHDWILANFKCASEGMCPKMESIVARWVSEIEKTKSHHDKILNAHYNILNAGAEGHPQGVLKACAAIESVWIDTVVKLGKRPLDAAKSEADRSFWGAVRKIKGKADILKENDLQFFMDETCMPQFIEDDKPLGDHWLECVPFDNRPLPEEFEKNDNSQAEHFITVFGSSVRFLSGWNAWAIYDGQGWHIDEYGNISQLFKRGCMDRTKERCSQLYKASVKYLKDGGTTSDDRYKGLRNTANRLKDIYDTYSNLQKSEAVLKRAREIADITMDFVDLNPDPYVLAMPDGNIIRLDKRTIDDAKNRESQGFSIESNKREYYTTMRTRVSYKPLDQIDPKKIKGVRDTLDLLFPPVKFVDEDGNERLDRSYQRFIRKVWGHSLIGGNPEKKVIFPAGKPHTGKSTLLNWYDVIGDYSGGFNPSNVLKDDGGKPNPEMAGHFFRRVITATEPDRARIDASMLKRISGRDKMTMRKLYSNKIISGYVHFTVFLATNFPPTIVGEDRGTRDRIMAPPFENRVPVELDNKDATQNSVNEYDDAIFYWMLMGYRDYVREGLDEKDWHPLAWNKTREFVTELSDVGSFLADMCDIASDDVMAMCKKKNYQLTETQIEEVKYWTQHTLKQSYEVYKRWMGEGQKCLGPRTFYNSIKGQGIEAENRRHGNLVDSTWLGLKFKEDKMRELFGNLDFRRSL